jgi:hypothetical protein
VGGSNYLDRVLLCESTIGYRTANLSPNDWLRMQVNATITGAVGAASGLNGTHVLTFTGGTYSTYYYGKTIIDIPNNIATTLSVNYVICRTLSDDIYSATCPYHVSSIQYPNSGGIVMNLPGAAYTNKYYLSDCNNVQSSGWNTPGKLVTSYCESDGWYDGTNLYTVASPLIRNAMMTWTPV